MPASQKVKYQQFELSARPAWWLRRWTKFPLFFQATKSSFEVIIKKIMEPQLDSGTQPPPSNLNFYVEFSDGSQVEFKADVSSMKVGDTIRLPTSPGLLAPTGDTRICLDMGRLPTKGHRFHTLYAFVISAEATLVFLLLNVILVGVIAVIVAVMSGSK